MRFFRGEEIVTDEVDVSKRLQTLIFLFCSAKTAWRSSSYIIRTFVTSSIRCVPRKTTSRSSCSKIFRSCSSRPEFVRLLSVKNWCLKYWKFTRRCAKKFPHSLHWTEWPSSRCYSSWLGCSTWNPRETTKPMPTTWEPCCKWMCVPPLSKSRKSKRIYSSSGRSSFGSTPSTSFSTLTLKGWWTCSRSTVRIKDLPFSLHGTSWEMLAS